MSGRAHARAAVAESEGSRDLADEIRQCLSERPRRLPTRYLYDALGSALFDAICRLPWYPVTRAEMRLLEAHGGAMLAAAGTPAHIVELGAGNGSKLAALLTAGGAGLTAGSARPTAGSARITTGDAVTAGTVVHLVDVSPAALATAARAVTAVAPLRVEQHEASYQEGVERIREATGGGRTLVLFLGSNIGNFDPPAARGFLRQLRGALGPGDAVLIGADLVKPPAELVRAYDDPLGVTAAFNLNLLVRLNRELQADFDLPSFKHRACWNEAASRVEMHLVSTRPQRVRVRGAGLEMTLRGGECIWTESSYKYSASGVRALLVASGFRVREQWIDQPSQFALTLAGA